MLLILQLGSTNDASGKPDEDAHRRAARVLALFDQATAAGRDVSVLTSGGTDPGFPFNPTLSPHWKYISRLLLSIGLPEHALYPSGLPALTGHWQALVEISPPPLTMLD